MYQDRQVCCRRGDLETMLSWKWVKWWSCHRCYYSDSIQWNGNGKPHQHQEIQVKYVPWFCIKFFQDHFIACKEMWRNKSYIWSLWRKFVKTANKMFPNYWNCSCTIYNHRYNTNHSLGYPRILGFNRNQKWIDRIPQSKVISCSYSPINQVCNFLQK